ncbi:MAG: hypothetical protein HYS18_08010 [Burkholderiales bacterium]|nr:hypothetical protein [Burkholderiales bacterium]
MNEACTPLALLDRLLGAAGDDLVLVGGQALAFWMLRYGVRLPPRVVAVSRDTDFLTLTAADRQVVYRLADAIEGKAIFPSPRALTALVGQAIKVVSDAERVNVDVVFKIHGTDADRVRAASIEVKRGGVSFRVMHPLHVLKSRLDNLYSLKEKQEAREKSEMQLRCAIEVVRRFLHEVATTDEQANGERSAALRHIKLIETMALSDAGRKVADRHGIHVADAIEPSAVRSKKIFGRKLTQLLVLMSDARKKEISG